MIAIILILTTVNTALGVYALLQVKPKFKHKNAILLDTSALIDGRIVEVVKSGFVPSQLLIPRFVIAELQLLADKADHLKRERARFGLSVIQEIQASKDANVLIISNDITDESGVDEKLVKLAKKQGALLLTTDYNLLKVAEIEGVRVLNINELSQNLRPTRLPGEFAELKIVGKGQERTQGVGYLEDGTLVVVEKAGSSQGKTIKVEFTRNLQTSAGRMMFAKLVGATNTPKRPVPKPASQSNPERNVIKSSRSSKPVNKRKPSRRPKSVEQDLIDAINNQ